MQLLYGKNELPPELLSSNLADPFVQAKLIYGVHYMVEIFAIYRKSRERKNIRYIETTGHTWSENQNISGGESPDK